MPEPISLKQAAALLKISLRTVQRGVESGKFHVVDVVDGVKYLDADQVCDAYGMQRRTNGVSDAIKESRLKRLRSHNRRLEQKLDRLQSSAVLFSDLWASWDAICAKYKTTVLSATPEIAAKLERRTVTAEVASILRDEINAMLNGLSEL